MVAYKNILRTLRGNATMGGYTWFNRDGSGGCWYSHRPMEPNPEIVAIRNSNENCDLTLDEVKEMWEMACKS